MTEGRTKLSKYKKNSSMAVPAVVAVLVIVGVAALTYVRVVNREPQEEQQTTGKIEKRGEPPCKTQKAAEAAVRDEDNVSLDIVVAERLEVATDVVVESTPKVAEVKESPTAQGPTNAQIAKAGAQLKARMANKRVVPPGKDHTKELFRRSMNLESLEISGEGTLDVGTFKKEFMMKQPEFFACAKSARERGVALAGEVTLAFEVSQDGRVHKGDIAESTIEDIKLRHCLVFKLARMVFTPPTGGISSVRYTLKF